ncbi:MAG TPA: bifunctional adenosylcobinamide kinase/adenosylcobinamide-phosphate guanylyltransferase [Syntrophobacteraceae bacterium]|nr:bifunctional adenosylcobinamide kinase/adenosylcobinamide-phosphate guanylyltransferase [Syntrophobacteraceae bacterium]
MSFNEVNPVRRSRQNIETPLLVLGGARSGKSAWAESVVGRLAPPYIYIATAQPLDEEMKLRIEQHRERRKGGQWETIESPIDLCGALESLKDMHKAVLVDCISLWLNNLLCSTKVTEAEAAVDAVCAVIEAVDYPLVIVSNDTGGGIVPDNALARRFQDLCGLTNQKLARICASVFLVTAGLPLRLK